MVDLQLSKGTVRTYRSSLKTFFETVKEPITENTAIFFAIITRNILTNQRCYFKRYLKLDIVDSFKFPKQPYIPKRVPTKEQLQQFYAALPTLKECALFLLYATSGLRKSEIMLLKLEDLDLDRRMIIPNVHSGNTKKSWIGFFNEEAKEVLTKYLAKCQQSPQYYRKVRVFNPSKNPTLWKEARERTRLNITPKVLRDFLW